MSAVQEGFKEVMRHYAQGVTVVTARHGERLIGITVSSFTSISMNPPLAMIAIAKASSSHEPLVNAEHFAVNVLSSDQAWVSERFAGRVAGVRDKFENIPYRLGSTGSPLILGAVAWLECKRWRVYEGGDHSIIIGEVIEARLTRRTQPLVYYNRSYTTVTDPFALATDYYSLLHEW